MLQDRACQPDSPFLLVKKYKLRVDLIDKQRFDWILTGIDFEKLNKWEEQFIESCEKQLKFKDELSFKQTEILERIYSDKWK